MASMTVALVHETFHGADGHARLESRLREARDRGADLAVLCELPLHSWAPATRAVHDEDAEPCGGPRERAMASAARDAGICVLGGVIASERSGRRFNRALLFDIGGRVMARYDKLHLPSEEGFWESDHYSAGDDPPRRVDGLDLPLGIQICSDLNRPQGCLLLAAQGVAVVLAPRATPLETYERWRMVIRGNAVTGCIFIVSVNRPGPDDGVGIGGPSLVVAPDGQVVLESTEPLSVLELDGDVVAANRRLYPGYLPMRCELYARGWRQIEHRT